LIVPLRAFRILLRRDLKLAFRRVSEWANPLLFFIAISAMFPLALDPGRFDAGVGDYNLQSLGVGVLFMASLLSSFLGLERLFLNDVEDGSLEQLLVGPAPLLSVIYGKLVAHWLVSGLPLVVLVPIVGFVYALTPAALATLAAALLLVTPALTVLVGIGAALTINLRSAAAIIGLLVLPLCSPILIFGARATVLALDAEPVAGPLYLLASLAVLAVSLGPLAIAAAVRVGLE
jgi:heme exporter protein B